MMRFYVFFLLLALATPLQAGVKGDVRQGSKLYAQEKYGAALSKYEQALQADPHNDQARFGAGAAAYYLKEYDQAAQAFENTAETSAPLRQDSLFNLGNTHYRAGHKEEAIAAYKQAILHNPQDKEAIHNLQLLLKEQQQQNKNNQNNENKDKNSQNQDQQQQQNNKGQAPQQQDPQQNKQPQEPQPEQEGMNKQDANRVMQLARDNEYKRPTQPGQNGEDPNVEKDW